MMNMLMLRSLLGNGGNMFGKGGGQADGDPCLLGKSSACPNGPQTKPDQQTPQTPDAIKACGTDPNSQACKDAIKKQDDSNTQPDKKDLGGATNKPEYACVARKNPKTGAILENWNDGNGGKYVVVDVKLTSKGMIGTQKNLLLGKLKDAAAIPANQCFVGGVLKEIEPSVICCKAVRTVNGKKVCDEHPELQGKIITEYFDMSVTRPRFEGTCNSSDIKTSTSNTADQKAQNNPDSLTPANPQSPSGGDQGGQPQTQGQGKSASECAAYANSLPRGSFGVLSPLNTRVYNTTSSYPECSNKIYLGADGTVYAK
jgi:hypothetical protein